MDNKDAVLLADLNNDYEGFTKKIYEELQSKTDRFDLVNISINHFRDGEIKVKIADNVRRKRCYFIHDSFKKPAEWFLELALINEALSNSSAGEITDILPYMRFCRQDRKDESRVSINAKAVAEILSIHAKRAITIDAHFAQIPGFYNIPFDNLYSGPTVAKYFREHYPNVLENCVILSPDVGGAHRAEAFAKRLGIENIAICHKTRPKAGEIKRLRIIGEEEVRDKNVLIIDDIIDSGGTITRAAEECKKSGALNVYAYATHGLFTNGTDLRGLNRAFISDTAYRAKKDNIEVISVKGLLAEAIYRINEGNSISELFD